MEKEYNYELLRFISTISVIMIHISTSYLNEVKNYNNINFLIAVIFTSVSRCAVPCFLMLSGAFNLKSKNKDFKTFYKKIFNRIVKPTIFFSSIYILYSVISCVNNQEASLVGVFINEVKMLFLGKPFYHLWYLYMIIPVYLFTPFIIILKDKLNRKKFAVFAMILLLYSTISEFTSTHKLVYDLGSCIAYSSYYIMGWIIKDHYKEKKLKFAVKYFGLFFLTIIVVVVFRYYELIKIKEGFEVNYIFVDNFSPLIVLASLFLFLFFTNLNMKRNIKIWKNTFNIYLIHAGIWDVLFRFSDTSLPAIIFVPFYVSLVYITSFYICEFYALMKKHVITKYIAH